MPGAGSADPLNALEIDGTVLPSYVFIHDGPRVFRYYTPKRVSKSCSTTTWICIAAIQVSTFRCCRFRSCSAARRAASHGTPHLRLLNGVQKFFAVRWLGRDNFVRFSNTVSLRRIAAELHADRLIAQKRWRAWRACTSRVSAWPAVGPSLPTRSGICSTSCLASKAIEKAVEDEARSKKISHEKAQQNAIALMEDRRRLLLRNRASVRSRAELDLEPAVSGHQRHQRRARAPAGAGQPRIVYVPCHRSHGLSAAVLRAVSPGPGAAAHIAAGINLNFWPAGPIFRRLGAFAPIRRTFKGNSFTRRCSANTSASCSPAVTPVEYFVGRRPLRTGRLLEPKPRHCR